MKDKKVEFKRTIINSKEIVHLDVIKNTTTVRPLFWERIKILIGKPIIVVSEIFTLHEECHITETVAHYKIPPLIQKKEQGQTQEGHIPMSSAKFTNEPEEISDSDIENIKSLKKNDPVRLLHKRVEHQAYVTHANHDGSLDIITTEHGARFNDVWAAGQEKATADLYYLPAEAKVIQMK